MTGVSPLAGYSTAQFGPEQTSRRMGYFIQQAVNGIHNGALYALLAFGYSIAHCVLRQANFAHGALFAFAGQMTIMFTGLGWQALWLTYPAALAMGLVAALGYTAFAASIIGRHVLEPLRRRTPNTGIAASLGVLLVLMETVRLATASNIPWLAPFLNTVLESAPIGGFAVTTTPLKLLETAVAGLVIAGASLYLNRSVSGLALRAVSQDERAASLMGVDGRKVFSGAMLWSGLICGFAGVLAAFHYGNIDFGTGISFAVKILFISSLGGLASPLGAAVGGLVIGLFEAFWDGYLPSIWRDVATYAVLCAALIAFNRERIAGL
jgi:branched-chain amino acid transport system permease protein